MRMASTRHTLLLFAHAARSPFPGPDFGFMLVDLAKALISFLACLSNFGLWFATELWDWESTGISSFARFASRGPPHAMEDVPGASLQAYLNRFSPLLKPLRTSLLYLVTSWPLIASEQVNKRGVQLAEIPQPTKQVSSVFSLPQISVSFDLFRNSFGIPD